VTVYLQFCGTANSHEFFGWHLVLLDKTLQLNTAIAKYINKKLGTVITLIYLIKAYIQIEHYN